MKEEYSGSLKELQELDLALEELRMKVAEYDPLLAEIEEPAQALEQEVTTLGNRVQEMNLEERRLEHSADDRRARMKKLKERLKGVRNLREEAAVQAEMDLVKAAFEGEEREALSLLDQIRKMEVRLEELDARRVSARAEVEPRRLQLLAEQKAAVEEFAKVKEQREKYTSSVESRDLQSYQRIRNGGRSVAVASLTPDGACGHCFGMIPLQVQNEIRKGGDLVPCEACGVLLGAEEEVF